MRRNISLCVRSVVILQIVAGIWLARNELGNAQTTSSRWSAPSDISAPVSAGRDLFGELVCDPYQNLHVLWSKGSDTRSEIYYRSDVNGIWSAPIDVIALPEPVTTRLSAAITSPDPILHLIWQHSFTQGDVYYSQVPLTDAGRARAWSPPQVLIAEVDRAEILADDDGVIRIVFGKSDADSLGYGVYYIESEDRGVTWTDPITVMEGVLPYPSTISAGMAVDEAGRIHVTVSIRSYDYGAYSELGYLRSTDDGRTWSAYRQIYPEEVTPYGLSSLMVYAFGADEVHLTWHDPRRMHQWSFDGGETWSEPIEIMSLDAGFGGDNVLAEDSDGALHVVTGVQSGVFSASWDGSEWSAPERIENRSMDPHGQKIVVCQGNQLHVVYDDRVTADTTVWYSHREIAAPHIDRRAMPSSSFRSTTATVTTPIFPGATTAAGSVASPAGTPVTADFGTISTAPPSSSVSPLLMSFVAATVLVVVVLAFVMIRRDRR